MSPAMLGSTPAAVVTVGSASTGMARVTPAAPALVLTAAGRVGPAGPQGPVGAAGATGPAGTSYGYANISDSQFTAAAPLAIMAVTPTPLTIDGMGPQSDSAQLRVPFAGWSFWRANRFYPRNLHDGYVLRVSFTAMSLVIDNAIKLTMDIGGAIGTFYDDRRAFDTAAGEARVFNFEISFFDAQTFVANGAAFLIDPLTAPVLLWGASILVQPISVGSP